MRACLAACLFLLLPAANTSHASPLPSTSRPPPRSEILSSHRIPGYRRGYALIYRSHGLHLGVVVGRTLIWKKSLTAKPASVVVPGPHGLFAISVNLPDGSGVFYAFHLAHYRVSSGIADRPEGMASGDEGVRRSQQTFEVLNRDAQHVGSVLYRLVTPFSVCGIFYCAGTVTREPDYSPDQYPRPNGIVSSKIGDVMLMRLEVAADQHSRELGLMYRTSLDPDSGMVFAFNGLVRQSFWMRNTYIPLSIAFLAPDGTIQQIIDMKPLDDTVLYSPDQPYQYAIEVNQGYFAKYGIVAGDRVELTLTR